MFGFEPLTLPAMYLLAQMSGCADMGQASVQVQLTASDPPYDTSMSMNELTSGFANNPDSTLSTEPGWHLGGLTLSNIQTRYSVNFHQQTSGGTGCVQVSQVVVDIIYTPVIYIASDFLHKQCQYSVTVAHEQRHVGTDLETINDFTPLMRDSIQQYVDSLGPQGPYNRGDLQAVQNNLLDQVIAAAQPIADQLAEVRRERQAAFDTEENYRAENSLCEGE